MLLLLLLVALLSLATIECVLGQAVKPKQLFGCSRGKSGKQAQVCEFSAGPFHMLCGTFQYHRAEEECQSHGWRLASITEENLLFAQQLFPICSATPRVWIASLNGLNAEPFLMFAGNFTLMGELYSWIDEYQQVLCEDIPVITQTTSLTTTVEQSSGVVCTTTTVTTTKKAHHHHRGDGDCDRRFHGNHHQKAAEACGPRCDQCIGRPTITDCSCCSDACPVSYLGLHVVSGDRMSYADAKAACCRHGWSLADFTSGMASVIREEFRTSCTQDSSLVLWVRSYEGVAGVNCIQVESGQEATEVRFGHTSEYCDGTTSNLRRFALCQEDPVFFTGVGPAVGALTTTTETIISTSHSVVPESTRTVTKTVTCPAHRPHKPASDEDDF